MSKKIYLVYRVYSRQERPDDYMFSPLFAWCDNKDIVKLFMKQRDKDKYRVRVYHDDEVKDIIDDFDNDNLKLDIGPMTSVSSGETLYLVTMQREVTEFKPKVIKLCRNAATLAEHLPDDSQLYDQVEMFLKLDDLYSNALTDIGFWPLEVESLYDSIEEPEYCGVTEQCLLYGLPLSVEAFIKVFRDDM